MNRILGLIFVLLATLGFGFAQEKMSGYVQAFGHVRGADGQMKDITGMWLPYTIEPIKAAKISPLSVFGLPMAQQPPHRQPRNTVGVYLADAGSAGYGIFDPSQFADPSTLDDMQATPTILGAPWQNLMFGMQTPDTHNFLIRWIVYGTFTQGLGANVNAFSNVQADFGVIWAGSTYGAGTWKITISVAAAGVICNTANLYVAQQFRSSSNLNGEGPFDESIFSVYSTTSDVNVGTSNYTFYYDANDDGKYDETELEAFTTDTPPPFGNLLFGIYVNTSQTTNNIQPNALSLLTGDYVSGDVTDVWQVDQSYYVTSMKDSGALAASIEIDGKAAATTATSYHFLLNCAQDKREYTLNVYFYNYQTSTWDFRATYRVGNSDTVFDTASTNNPAKYISSGKLMRARIDMIVPPPAGPFHFALPAGGPTARFGHLPPQPKLRVEFAGWQITHP